MSNGATQLSNPFSTGGGGHNFENNVQSAFVVLMLSGGVVPCLPPLPIRQIILQGKYAGYDTDDFIVFAEVGRARQIMRRYTQGSVVPICNHTSPGKRRLSFRPSLRDFSSFCFRPRS
jgi:hypothetical protein